MTNFPRPRETSNEKLLGKGMEKDKDKNSGTTGPQFACSMELFSIQCFQCQDKVTSVSCSINWPFPTCGYNLYDRRWHRESVDWNYIVSLTLYFDFYVSAQEGLYAELYQ